MSFVKANQNGSISRVPEQEKDNAVPRPGLSPEVLAAIAANTEANRLYEERMEARRRVYGRTVHPRSGV